MKNYARFYGIISKLPIHTEGMKEEFVMKYTSGRTTSLREMTAVEYDNMCRDLEGLLSNKNQLRASRSNVLLLMQRLGVDTTNWPRINAFCLEERIAGKVFYRLSIAELDNLAVKLRTIERKGGLKALKVATPPQEAPPAIVTTETMDDIMGVLNKVNKNNKAWLN